MLNARDNRQAFGGLYSAAVFLKFTESSQIMCVDVLNRYEQNKYYFCVYNNTILMKLFKSFAILLLVALSIAMILVVVLPTAQRVERRISINAPVETVYDYLTRLDHFNKWSVWNQQDSSIQHSITGTDGTLGAVSSWKGDPALSGEGEIRISSLELNKEIKHTIRFIQPKQMNARSEFDLEDAGGTTRVKWTFKLDTPRPWNVFNLFNSMDKQLGKDFEDGLRSLKTTLEKKEVAGAPQTYEVVPMNFPVTTFVAYRSMTGMDEIQSFFNAHMPRLFSIISEASLSPGIPSGLYYSWDMQGRQTDMALGIPISPAPEGGLDRDSVEIITLPGSKALYVDYYGPYDQTMAAYETLDKYIKEQELKQILPVIEQYITDPQKEKDAGKWLTRIIYLVE